MGGRGLVCVCDGLGRCRACVYVILRTLPIWPTEYIYIEYWDLKSTLYRFSIEEKQKHKRINDENSKVPIQFFIHTSPTSPRPVSTLCLKELTVETRLLQNPRRVHDRVKRKEVYRDSIHRNKGQMVTPFTSTSSNSRYGILSKPMKSKYSY